MKWTQRYGADPDAKSHGEAFLNFFQQRLVPKGLYLMDEPEAALSPQRQLALLAMMFDLVADGAQFIIATHSPLLLAFPGARIYQLRCSRRLRRWRGTRPTTCGSRATFCRIRSGTCGTCALATDPRSVSALAQGYGWSRAPGHHSARQTSLTQRRRATESYASVLADGSATCRGNCSHACSSHSSAVPPQPPTRPLSISVAPCLCVSV